MILIPRKEKNMDNSSQDLSLESIITTAISLPGVKISRNAFLTDCFKNENVDIHEIIDNGPVVANCPREMLESMANSLIIKRTSESSIASFVAGLPGGLAMGIAIPADVIQFFAVALRLAQELSYLYGANDLWKNGEIDASQVNSQLVLYCGVMFGVSGAANGVRLLSAQLAKTAAKKIPQKALTKTFWYPIVKQIGKAIGVKVTKSTVAKGVSKVIPIIGGVISGGLTFASMMPMGKRLAATLDGANFGYTEEAIMDDVSVIESLADEENEMTPAKPDSLQDSINEIQKGWNNLGTSVSGFFAKAQKNISSINPFSKKEPEVDPLGMIEKLAKLRDSGAISEEDYQEKKAELLNRI